MRVLSQSPGLTVQIRPQRQRSLGDGSIEITQEPIYVKFRAVADGAFLYENEEAGALKHFAFPGNTQNLGEAIPTSPIDRISVCDTREMAKEEGWDEATEREVEDRLLRYAEDDPLNFLIVTTTPIQAPYPNFDTDDRDPEGIVLRLVEDGHDVETVLHYERIFGSNRPEMIAELEKAVEIQKEMTVTA